MLPRTGSYQVLHCLFMNHFLLLFSLIWPCISAFAYFKFLNKISLTIPCYYNKGILYRHNKKSMQLLDTCNTSPLIENKGNYTANLNKSEKIKEILQPFLEDDLLLHTLKEWNRPLPSRDLFRPLVLVGPSGVGKGRLLGRILKDYGRYFGKIVSHTTRKPRPGEQEGVHYFYIDEDTFKLNIANDTFIEWAVVHDNYYGTSINAWKQIQANGKISIFEIDIQGAKNIKKAAQFIGIYPKYVFVAPPNIDVLRERLDLRGTETEEQKNIRVANAAKEIEQAQAETFFDLYLTNNDIDEASNSLFRKLRDWYPSLPSAARIRMLQRRIKKVKQLLQEQSSDLNNEEGQIHNNDQIAAFNSSMGI